jgi:hypothetical protein
VVGVGVDATSWSRRSGGGGVREWRRECAASDWLIRVRLVVGVGQVELKYGEWGAKMPA